MADLALEPAYRFRSAIWDDHPDASCVALAIRGELGWVAGIGLVQRAPAFRPYEQLDFAHGRELEVWTLEPLVFQEHKVRSVRAEAHARMRRGPTWREPWQPADEPVASLEAVEGLGRDRGTAFLRRSDRRHKAALEL